jgi:hypothetical protein
VGEFTHAAHNPIRERDERIAMLEARVSDLTRLHTEACAALADAGVSDWVTEEGSDPKEGETRLLTVAERIRILCSPSALKADTPKSSTVAVFQHASGNWGWVVTPGRLAGGVPRGSREEAVEAAKAWAKREGWPEVDLTREEDDCETDVRGAASFSGAMTIDKGLAVHPKCKSLDCALCHGLPPNAGPR